MRRPRGLASPGSAAICGANRGYDSSRPMQDTAYNVQAILAGQAPADRPVTVKGWVRTRRDSKAGISFVHLSDGSAFHPLQVVAPSTLPNYADEVLKITTGCAVEATASQRPSFRMLI